MFRQICTFVATTTLLFAVTAFAEEPKGVNLPLKRVVLFSSGVGFFENAGKVENNAKVEMKFKIDQINDLLKSMVVQDLDGGQGLDGQLRLERPDHQDIEELCHRFDRQSDHGTTARANPGRKGRVGSPPAKYPASSWAWKRIESKLARTNSSTSRYSTY